MKQDSPRAATTIRRWEWLAIFLFWMLKNSQQSGLSWLEHFDEGVYASNLFFGEATGYCFPNQHLYAPPLLPALIEWSSLLWPVSVAAKSTVEMFAVYVLWNALFMAVRWFGMATTWVAILLVITSWPRLLFSHAVLTDIPVTAWMLAAVSAFVAGLAERRWSLVILGGVLTGLAWWTKYSGWLPLAIMGTALVVAAALPNVPFHGKRLTWLLPRLGMWGVGCLVAFVVWSPWLWSLQSRGGYSAVAANHRGYLVGLSGWWDSARTQLRYQSQDASIPLVVIGVCAAFLVICWRRNPAMKTASDVSATDAGVAPPEERFLGRIALAVWVVALVVTIPFYRPYFRLVVPLDIPLRILIAAGVVAAIRYRVGPMDEGSSTFAVNRARLAGGDRDAWAMAVGVVAAVMLVGHLGVSLAHELRDDQTRGRGDVQPFVTVCRQLGEAMRKSARETPSLHETEPLAPSLPASTGMPIQPYDIAVYVYGEPAVMFQLRVKGFENAVPVSHLGFARPGVPPSPVPTFVVIGPHAEKSNEFPRQWAESSPRLKKLVELPARHGWIVRYEEPDWNRRIAYTLYRVE